MVNNSTIVNNSFLKNNSNNSYEFNGKACDLALQDFEDLITEQYRKWFCQVFYKIGKQRFIQLASTARADGKDPRRYFVWLLKQETRRKEQPKTAG